MAKREVKQAKLDKKDPKIDVIDAEQRKLSKAAQTNKKRKRLLERIETGERRQKGRVDKLTAKRVKIDADSKTKKAESKKANKKAGKV
jgi:hypothetical protein